jgi:hypothetical protein
MSAEARKESEDDETSTVEPVPLIFRLPVESVRSPKYKSDEFTVDNVRVPPSLTSISPVPLNPQYIRAERDIDETLTEDPVPLIFRFPVELVS